jgi:ABC-type transport system involved in multi-copper enzyme maturation permease subunit
MQDFLTSLLVGLSIVFFAYFVLAFVLFVSERLNNTTPDATADAPIASVKALPTPSIQDADRNLNSQLTALIELQKIPSLTRSYPKAIASNPTLKVSDKVSAQPKLNAQKLRKLCSDNQIKWRDAHGKNKHLSTTEMKQLLKIK